ncbi:hypothetical protein PVE_P0214 (plasmid) [Pseudomonas veronii 1YdBTEX2]|uniref:Aminomethyltransferase folate-binding domain-containing protein n=2 Tax=Pseudomonas veronii TaxID=76761 RepID=A0ABS0VR15_PSEVE|nr:MULTISPECIES: hypothetical protein [Pseudomonas]SBW85254.1 hypothetical protein PVE_P0214 [Pseudomonas veronii 1YdBTEX2]KAA0946208.1 hypothetical protein FQ182_13570 [Pseudomonas sp. ANT_H4]KAA0947156.1 hypothetical protein FQ186_25980 [Pseudomonas sp. ANT_H14]MBI6557259.1 hypothetical protein [Pseudomonas veronii]MBI6653972.1 hypothetical protein [Pseudomonas veronii]
MYAYFPKSKTYWAYDENLQVQAIAIVDVADLLSCSSSELHLQLAESCCGQQNIPSLRIEVISTDHGRCLCIVTGDISELLEEGAAMTCSFEISRNEILMSFARLLEWSDAQTAHAADNLLAEVGDETVVALSNGKCLRMPASPGAVDYIRLTQLQFELGRWHVGDFRTAGPELLSQVLIAAGARHSQA